MLLSMHGTNHNHPRSSLQVKVYLQETLGSSTTMCWCVPLQQHQPTTQEDKHAMHHFNLDQSQEINITLFHCQRTSW